MFFVSKPSLKVQVSMVNKTKLQKKKNLIKIPYCETLMLRRAAIKKKPFSHCVQKTFGDDLATCFCSALNTEVGPEIRCVERWLRRRGAISHSANTCCSASVTNSRVECLLSANGSLIRCTMEMGRSVCGPCCSPHQWHGFIDRAAWTPLISCDRSLGESVNLLRLLNRFLVAIYHTMDPPLPEGSPPAIYFL